ncbi:MAG: glycosyl hydrolase family 18 protein [Negativicutes bacterium]|nr:glycosyl hydrolase family 18 protein [Negativicutes bacterium]
MRKLSVSLLLAIVVLMVSGLVSAGDLGPGDKITGGSTTVTKPIITEYFGIFNDGSADNFHAALNLNPPYQKWDITYIAFVHTYYQNGYWVVDYENARGGGSPAAGDTDRDRIAQLKQAALAVNPNMKFIVSLGWGRSDFSNGAKNPVQFAQSVCRIIQDNGLDGFDIDYESDYVSQSQFIGVMQELRRQLDALGAQMGKHLYLSITPATTGGFDVDTINSCVDIVQMQSYDAGNDAYFAPSNVLNLKNAKGEGIIRSRILFGRDIENNDTLSSGRYGISNIPQYVLQNGLGGLMGWRVNAGNQMRNGFQGVIMLGNAFN